MRNFSLPAASYLNFRLSGNKFQTRAILYLRASLNANSRTYKIHSRDRTKIRSTCRASKNFPLEESQNLFTRIFHKLSVPCSRGGAVKPNSSPLPLCLDGFHPRTHSSCIRLLSVCRSGSWAQARSHRGM